MLRCPPGTYAKLLSRPWRAGLPGRPSHCPVPVAPGGRPPAGRRPRAATPPGPPCSRCRSSSTSCPNRRYAADTSRVPFAGLEADQQVATGAQHPGRLGEDARLAGGRGVDDRVPQHHAGELVVGVRQVGQRAHRERQVGVVASCHGDHARRQVHSLDPAPAVGEVPAHPARAAPRVEDPCVGHPTSPPQRRRRPWRGRAEPRHGCPAAGSRSPPPPCRRRVARCGSRADPESRRSRAA